MSPRHNLACKELITAYIPMSQAIVYIHLLDGTYALEIITIYLFIVCTLVDGRY